MKDWLRKAGTNEVFVRTAILAERNDMLAITEKEAMELRALVAKVKPVVSTIPEAAKINGVDFDSMDENALRLKSAEMKIAIPEGIDAEKIRRRLKKIAKKDAAILDGEVVPPAPTQTESDPAIVIEDKK